MSDNTVNKNVDLKKRCSLAYEIVGTMVTALVFLAIVFCFLFRVVSVEGDSMQPTLLDQERLLITCGYVKPQHSDIVVVSRDDNVPLIKRVIACEGDSVVIRDGVVVINGKELDEPYLDSATLFSGFLDTEVTVPENCFIVLGDNRGNSHDSRDIGFVKAKDIMGKVICRIFPIDKLGAVN